MGDPQAGTTAGNEDLKAGTFERVAEVLGGEREPDVPEPLRSRLVQSGYIKIEATGLFASDRSVSSEHVCEVSGDRARLDVHKDEALTRES